MCLKYGRFSAWRAYKPHAYNKTKCTNSVMIFNTPDILLHIEHPMKLMNKAVYMDSISRVWVERAVMRSRYLHGENLNRVTDG